MRPPRTMQTFFSYNFKKILVCTLKLQSEYFSIWTSQLVNEGYYCIAGLNLPSWLVNSRSVWKGPIWTWKGLISFQCMVRTSKLRSEYFAVWTTQLVNKSTVLPKFAPVELFNHVLSILPLQIQQPAATPLHWWFHRCSFKGFSIVFHVFWLATAESSQKSNRTWFLGHLFSPYLLRCDRNYLNDKLRKNYGAKNISSGEQVRSCWDDSWSVQPTIQHRWYVFELCYFWLSQSGGAENLLRQSKTIIQILRKPRFDINVNDLWQSLWQWKRLTNQR